MNEHFLSQLHIEKLGHPLEEIRNRALSSVISKYNLNLVDENNTHNTSILFQKLFDWFTFDEYSEEKKVFSLLQRLLKTSSGQAVVSEMGVNNFLKKLDDLDKKTKFRYSTLVNDVKLCLDNVEDGALKGNGSKEIHSTTKKLILFNIHNNGDNAYNSQVKCSGNVELDLGNKTSHTSENPEFPVFISSTCDKLDTNKAYLEKPPRRLVSTSSSKFRVELFPWQNLVTNDKQVLSSVFDGLKYTDDKCSTMQSCVFFYEIVLRDFPPEIFIQRPLILRTFLQLLNSVETDLIVPIMQCLIKFVQCLKTKIKLALNPLVYNRKKEFHTTCVYPDDNLTDSGQKKLYESFHLNFSLAIETGGVSSETETENESSGDSHQLKKCQLSVPEFIFEALTSVLLQMKRKDCTQEEINHMMELCFECLTCLTMNLKCDICQGANDLKDKFYKIFGMIQELIKIHRHLNVVHYAMLLNFAVNLLNALNPSSDLDLNDVMPKSLQLEFGNCIFHCSLYLMFPQLHSEILKYLKTFVGQRERERYHEFKEIQLILESMKYCAIFTKSKNTLKTKTEKLECALQALPSLYFHENYAFVRCFLSHCLLKWCRNQLVESEVKMREEILLKLLSHGNSNVKTVVYNEISQVVIKLLGKNEAAQPTYEFPGDKLEFLFSVNVLTEIICHGLNSSSDEVFQSSNDIIVHLLRSKFLMSESCWTDFIAALSPCLGFLECYADKSTLLGRCIIKMFDPDVAQTSGLPQLELIKGNIRLLFAKNGLTREEAISRLFWLLNREDVEDRKLPRMSVLTKLNLSPICVSVKQEEYSTLQKSFYDPGKVCDVLEMLATQNLEPNVRKSAVSQLSVMMEDVLLHSTFLEQKGLKLMLDILDSSLVEGDYRHYPDSVIPVIDILKQISLHNAAVCQELASQTPVFYNILRSLFLFSSDDRLRRNATQLLCLLLYCDCTLRVPSDKSSGHLLSFPDIVFSKMVLPFASQTHWKSSKHFEPCLRKAFLGKENCSKLLRIFWAVEWTGSLSELLSMKESDISEKTRSPGIPDDMVICYEDIEDLRKCSFSMSVKQLLFDIQNASSHEAVCLSIHKIQSYLLLYNIDKTFRREDESNVKNENVLSHLIWEATLERFLLSSPTCLKDESLLSLVVRFVYELLKTFKSERMMSWIEKSLTNIHQPLFKALRHLGKNQSGLKGRELRLSVVQLAQQLITLKGSVDSVKWFPYLELVSDMLKLDKRGNEFYNVAYVDWFLGLLVHLTRKCSFSGSSDCLRNLIVRIVEIIIAFHCTPDSAASFMGLNIVKNSVLVLNHILTDLQNNTEGWEQFWFDAFSRVIGHSENMNYCWLMSLWFTRDPIVRAASLQLFVGFSTTTTSCKLLFDRLNVPAQLIWMEAFKILVDENECCSVREKCGLLLSNLTANARKLFPGSFVENLNRVNFYQNMLEITENYQPDWNYHELILDDISNTFRGDVFTMPALVTSVCNLMQNVVSIEGNSAISRIVGLGILECLTRVFGEVPDSVMVCEKHPLCVDILRMYITASRLIITCLLSNSTAHSLLLQSQNSINHLFSMIDYNLYCVSSPTITSLKNQLWSEVLNLFATLLMEDPNDRGQGDKYSSFVALNRCMSENGVDNFTSSVYIALNSDAPTLRVSALTFLSNLFHHEIAMRQHVSVADIFERKISDKAVELSRRHGSKELEIPDKLTLDFGIRVADALRGLFLLSFDKYAESFKGTTEAVARALGGLSAVHKPVQNFCLKQHLTGFIVLQLKKIYEKLNLFEEISRSIKLLDKKRVLPLLQNVEILCSLINNLMHGNEAVKSDVATFGFSAVMHKLWPWADLMKTTILETILKTLCTFTHCFSPGCLSLVLSSNITVISQKKRPGSMTLLNAIVCKVADEIYATSWQPQILALCLQVLLNCCSVTECRSVLSKGSILQFFVKLQTTRKKRVHSDEAVDSWLKFLIVFSSHQEGQLALTKNQDVLDLILKMASTGPKFENRADAMTILRNVCFHQLNRYRMLNWCEFLVLLQDSLTSGGRQEKLLAANAVWILSCNSQKYKAILRSAGFVDRLETAKRLAVAGEDAEMEELIGQVLAVLRNK